MKRFTSEGLIYAFTTENLLYMDDLSIRNSKTLTIGGSYDHAIYAYLLGASQVYNIDINIHAKHYGELKHIALQHLSYNEFLKFFMLSPDSFHKDIYDILNKYLSPETRLFIRQMYTKHGDSIRSSSLFNNHHDTMDIKMKNTVYLYDADIYAITQKLMRQKEFLWETVDIQHYQKTGFDVILLSNVADYSHYMFGENHLEAYRDKIVHFYLNKLNPGGQLMLAYLFDGKNIFKSDERNPINSPDVRDSIYGDHTEILVKSAIDGAIYDIACVLTKDK